MGMEKPKKTFYRRVLPDVCIGFASTKGKQLFKDALPTGYLNCYFSLASQFRTQEEPAYCGLSSLVMVLNALAVDPGVVWKGVFRWYHEGMLDCCTPLEEIQAKGVTMDNLFCLALCNQLDGNLNRVDGCASLEGFREEIKNVTFQDDRAMIISYGRNVLGQTGTGHFSPVGGYNEQEDMVLILDVARFKYPPYWVPLPEMWKAMKSPDTETGLPRGYMTLWRADQEAMPGQPPLLFKVSRKLNAFNPMLNEVAQFLKKINDFLDSPVKETTDGDNLKAILEALLATSQTHPTDKSTSGSSSFLSLKLTERQLEEVAQMQADIMHQLIKAIEETALYQKLVKLVPSDLCCGKALFDTNECSGCQNGFRLSHADAECIVCLPHFLTVFLLSFPLSSLRCGAKQKKRNSNGDAPAMSYANFLDGVITSELEDSGCPRCARSRPDVEQKRVLLMNEVKQLRRQFSALMLTQKR